VGQLRSSADLKPARKPFQALGDLLAGSKAPHTLYGPRAVAATREGGVVWVADPGGRCLHIFDLIHRTYKKIDRAGSSHLLNPVALCLGPDNSVYVCDSENIGIHQFSADAGLLLSSPRLPEDLVRPAALYYHPATRELFVVDVVAHDIKVLRTDGTLLRTLGHRGSQRGEFNFPCAICGDRDSVWVVDAGNHRVQRLTLSGDPLMTFGQAGDAPGDLALPKGVALDSDGHVYVVDARFENMQIFDQAGQLLLAFGEEGTGPGEFSLPGGLFIDRRDRIWICDSYNGRVQVFDYLRPPAETSVTTAPAESPR
jgi:sugar lactone lactonase YvrE